MNAQQLFSAAQRLAAVSAGAVLTVLVVHALLRPVAAERSRALVDLLVERSVERLGPHRVGGPVVLAGGPVRTLRPVYDQGGRLVAVAATVTVQGYGGDLELLAACLPDGEIVSVTLVSSAEDRGLGRAAWVPDWLDLFVGCGTADRVPRRVSELTGEEADRVAGATVTFHAAAHAIEQVPGIVTRAVQQGEVR